MLVSVVISGGWVGSGWVYTGVSVHECEGECGSVHEHDYAVCRPMCALVSVSGCGWVCVFVWVWVCVCVCVCVWECV